MSQSLKSDKKMLILSIVAAAATVIAGIMHLQMVPRTLSENLGQAILYLVGGLLQIFWAVPVIKRWGRVWQIIGIVGTAVLFVLWYASRLHLISEGGISEGGSHNQQPGEFSRGNMTGGEFQRAGGPPRGIGMQIGRILPQIEIAQIAFMGLYITLSIMISKKKKAAKQV
ncbi:MAG: hypothetical protein P4K92_08055 [Candidatus Nitrosotalea sp.]|nr:hypothetical protein [Candidatus Nitrosotalea sp.]